MTDDFASLAAAGVTGFGPYGVNAAGVSHGAQLVSLTPKEAGVLAALVGADGALVGIDQLLDTVWGDDVVGIVSLNRCVCTLRAKLGTDAAIIRTHNRRGYSLVPPVQRTGAVASPSPQALALFGQAREFLGQRLPTHLQSALALLRSVVALDPDFIPAWLLIAEILVVVAGRGQDGAHAASRQACEAADQVLIRDPANASALAVRARMRMAIDGDLSVWSDLERAKRLAPDDWLVLCHYGWGLAVQGRLAAAAAAYDAAATINPLAPGALSGRAYLQLVAGSAEQARMQMHAAVARLPQADYLQIILSAAEADTGHAIAAIVAAERAIALSDNDVNARVALAYALARSGDMTAARAHLAAARGDNRAVLNWGNLVLPIYLIDGAGSARLAYAEAERTGCPYRAIARHDVRLAALWAT